MKEKINVTRSSMPSFMEYVKMIEPLWDSAWITNMGKYHKELEKKLKDYLNVQNISLVCNGHMALELTIQALGLTGEVITTPFTFISTTHAIVRNGLEPVFCDINLDDYTMDVSKIEDLITEKTSAIIPVHVYGNICNTEEIERIAKKYNLKVIYDAAHAFGVKINGQAIGNFGDASTFSFHATKVFNTIEGGGVTFKDEVIGEKLYNLKNFGIRNEELVVEVGANAKMNEFQAAMGICNLKHINNEIEKRKAVLERYRQRLANINGIKLLEPQKGVESNYAYFPVVFNEEILGFNRDNVYEELKRNNIFSRKYFYPLTSDEACFKNKYRKINVENARYISKNILVLPLYADLSLDNVDKICNLIINCGKNGLEDICNL